VFNVGDKVEVVGGNYCYTQMGAKGTVLNVLTHDLRIQFDFSTLSGGISSLIHSGIFVIPTKNIWHVEGLNTPHSKIIRKIKQLDAAFAKRQQTKKESVCV
jgi:hypothetical protein